MSRGRRLWNGDPETALSLYERELRTMIDTEGREMVLVENQDGDTYVVDRDQ